MIECIECEREEARDVRVTYTAGSTETLALCDGCAAEFENGGLVTAVVQTELCQ